jgi:hypothetical protein
VRAIDVLREKKCGAFTGQRELFRARNVGVDL